MDDSRRSFLKKAGLSALGIGAGFPLLRASVRALQDESEQAAPLSKQWAMVIDIHKCLQPEVIKTCIEACHREHNVPDIEDPRKDIEWIRTESFEKVFADQTHPHTQESIKQLPVMILCNHCASPSCVRVCPTKATWKREQDGIVMMDMHRCIGCRYCIAACPYGARSFNWQDPRPFIQEIRPEYPTRTKGVVEKCTFCFERIAKGMVPACVEACQKLPQGAGALTFGDLADANSEVVKILREKYTIRRRPGLGTAPNVFYVI
ncbi:MAG: 4Fe-4S dicluster domain-containing protein [Deltaproteobacteria bacterium]|nr:4Fe-4S dicluster domain-containing protein [Deltaproteobacteria bacterium]